MDPALFRAQLRSAARRGARRRRAWRHPSCVDGRFSDARRHRSHRGARRVRLPACDRSQDRPQPHDGPARRRRRRNVAARHLRPGRPSRCSAGRSSTRGCRLRRRPAASPSTSCRSGPRCRRPGVEALEIIDRAVEAGCLPPAPREGACGWCDFSAVCGPLEERRFARKNRDLPSIADLGELRRLP